MVTTKYKRKQVYLAEDVILSRYISQQMKFIVIIYRGCVIEERTVVGSGTCVGRDGGERTIITGSIIGKNCKIG
jgi:NDP-sugar pyrophosphorylase family protein